MHDLINLTIQKLTHRVQNGNCILAKGLAEDSSRFTGPRSLSNGSAAYDFQDEPGKTKVEELSN